MARSLEELRKQYAHSPSDQRARGPMGGPGGPRGIRKKGKPKNIKNSVKRMLLYVAPYKLQLFTVALCMLISTATSLAGAYMLRPIINNIADLSTPANDRIIYLINMLTVLGVVYLCGVFTHYLQARLMLNVSQNATEKIRNDLFCSLQRLSIRFFDSRPTGEIMSRFTNDVDNIDVMLNNSLVSVVSGAITLIGTFAMMLVTNVWLTLITIVFIPIFIKGGGIIA